MEIIILTLLKRCLQGLNPYCNERYSWRNSFQTVGDLHGGLNPYCNERYSWSNTKGLLQTSLGVLILIVMKDTHGDNDYSLQSVCNEKS